MSSGGFRQTRRGGRKSHRRRQRARADAGELELERVVEAARAGEVVDGGEAIVWQPPVPPGWRRVGQRLDGAKLRAPGGLVVIASAGLWGEPPERWAHVSVSGPSGRIPTWPELVAVRDAVVPGVECYQVAPPPERYVNLRPNVLHLWGCLDRPAGVLPVFEGVLPDGTRTI